MWRLQKPGAPVRLPEGPHRALGGKADDDVSAECRQSQGSALFVQ